MKIKKVLLKGLLLIISTVLIGGCFSDDGKKIITNTKKYTIALTIKVKEKNFGYIDLTTDLGTKSTIYPADFSENKDLDGFYYIEGAKKLINAQNWIELTPNTKTNALHIPVEIDEDEDAGSNNEYQRSAVFYNTTNSLYLSSADSVSKIDIYAGNVLKEEIKELRFNKDGKWFVENKGYLNEKLKLTLKDNTEYTIPVTFQNGVAYVIFLDENRIYNYTGNLIKSLEIKDLYY